MVLGAQDDDLKMVSDGIDYPEVASYVFVFVCLIVYAWLVNRSRKEKFDVVIKDEK